MGSMRGSTAIMLQSAECIQLGKGGVFASDVELLLVLLKIAVAIRQALGAAPSADEAAEAGNEASADQSLVTALANHECSLQRRASRHRVVAAARQGQAASEGK